MTAPRTFATPADKLAFERYMRDMLWMSCWTQIRDGSKAHGGPTLTESQVRKLLGYSQADLVAHFDGLLTAHDRFTWTNKVTRKGNKEVPGGLWVLGHVLPRAHAETLAQVLDRFHLTNLRPKCKFENVIEGDMVGLRVDELEVIVALLKAGKLETGVIALERIAQSLRERLPVAAAA